MYEPLWRASGVCARLRCDKGMPMADIHRLYGRMLEKLGLEAPKGTLVVYVTGVWSRQVPRELFERNKLVLRHAKKVNQNGPISCGKSRNSMEIWECCGQDGL